MNTNYKKMDKSFKIEDMMNPSNQIFNIDYLPMWNMLDNLDKKLEQKGGLANTPLKELFERIYEYGVTSIGLDKAMMQGRIDNLNEQNLKWFTKASDLEVENLELKNKIAELTDAVQRQ